MIFSNTNARVESLSSDLYMLRLKVASSAALENLLASLHDFINQRTGTQPLYILLDASSLDIAYTPRARERLEDIIAQIHQHDKMLRIALILPQTMSSCTAFLNTLLRYRETTQIRHTCFARSDEAVAWLQDLQISEALPAVQGF